MLVQENFFVILYGDQNFRELDHILSIRGAAIEIFLENSYTLKDTQIIRLNIVLLRSSLAQNVQAVRQTDFGKVRQAKQLKSTHVYDKWLQK